MVMSAERVDAIKRQGLDEAARRSHPDDFPALPGVPAARYSDPDFARLEQAAVFGHTWLMVAHLDELAEPGDFRLVDQIPQPVVLVRGADAEVRAFYNTCQHRGAELVVEASGNAGRRLTCPYHSLGVRPRRLARRLPGGAQLPGAGPRLPLAALRPVRDVGPAGLHQPRRRRPGRCRSSSGRWERTSASSAELAGRLHLVDHPSLEVDVNWKLPVDANIETYHVNTVHRDSAARILDQAATSIQLLRNGHSRMLVGTRDGKSMGDLMPFEPLFDGVGDLPDAGTFSFHVFPNLSIVFSGKGFVFFITNWPIGAEPVELPRPLLLVAGRRDRRRPRAQRGVRGDQPVGAARGPVGAARDAALDRQRRPGPGPARLPGAADLPPPRDHRPLPRRGGPRPPPGAADARRPPRGLMGDPVHPFVALMRRYCIDYTNSHDQSICDSIMDPDYVVHIGGFDLPLDRLYKPTVANLFERAPGLGLVVHELVLNGDRLCMSFSEHAAMPVDGGTANACWRGIGLYQWNGTRLTENWVEQDHLAMQVQLAEGVPQELEPPHLDPWVGTQPVAPDAAAEAVTRAWLEAGDLADAAAGADRRHARRASPWRPSVDPGADPHRRPVLGRAEGAVPHHRDRAPTTGRSTASRPSTRAPSVTLPVSGIAEVRDGRVHAVARRHQPIGRAVPARPASSRSERWAPPPRRRPAPGRRSISSTRRSTWGTRTRPTGGCAATSPSTATRPTPCGASRGMEHLRHVERHTDAFVSSRGYRSVWIPTETSMISKDDPDHTRQRRLIADRFTPRSVGALEADVRVLVEEAISGFAADGSVEVVDALAARIPSIVTCRMIGWDDDRWRDVRSWSERLMRIDTMGRDPQHAIRRHRRRGRDRPAGRDDARGSGRSPCRRPAHRVGRVPPSAAAR